MKTSQQGLAEIAAHEGIVTSRYKDSVGVWTIGTGHTVNAGHPDPRALHRDLSLNEIMEIFARDIGKFEARVNRSFKQGLTQSQFDAAVSFDFNTGAIHRATWVKQFNGGQIKQARKSFMNWRKPKEIIPRRQKECDLFFDDKYSGNGMVNVYPATKSGRVEWGKGKRMNLSAIGIKNSAKLKKPDLSNQPNPPVIKTNKANLIGLAIAATGSAFIAFWDKIQALF